MKKVYFLIILLILTVIGCKKDVISVNPSTELIKLSKVETQTFNLDTITSLEINGKMGTKIFYKRKDLNVSENEKVTLILKEFYDFEDLFFNNINTITDKNELLESSGVLFVNFKVGDKNIELREEAFLKIDIPDNRLKGNNIFSAKIDSLNQFEWEELKESRVLTEDEIVVVKKGRITVEVMMTDTLAYQYGKYFKLDSITSTLMTRKLDWINIDKFIKNTSSISFELTLNDSDIEFINSYIIYKNYNSFISRFHKKDSIIFKDIPFIKDSTSLIVIGFKNENFFIDKIKLGNNKKFNINLKEVSENDIKRMIDKL